MADPTSTRVFATAAQGPQGPSFRLRCMVLTEATARHGIALDCEPLLNAGEARRFSDGGLADRARLVLGARRRLRESYVRRREATDTVLIQRQADFLPTLSLERELAKDKRLILDVDDAIWLDSRGAGGHPLAALKRSARKVEWLAARADHIVAGNELLAEHLGRFNPEVSVVPTLIDTDASRARSGPSPSDEEVVLGWTGSASTSA